LIPCEWAITDGGDGTLTVSQGATCATIRILEGQLKSLEPGTWARCYGELETAHSVVVAPATHSGFQRLTLQIIEGRNPRCSVDDIDQLLATAAGESDGRLSA
jgi:hypothetical protein